MKTARTERPIETRDFPSARLFGRKVDLASMLEARFPGFSPPAGWNKAAKVYPVLATEEYLQLVKTPDYSDPVFAQIAPRREELDQAGEDDPMGEGDFEAAPGLLHRYPEKVLILATDACLVRCRHCMRKRIWKSGTPSERRPLDDRLERWTGYLASRPQIREVILSGGDPLTISNQGLNRMLSALRRIPSVESIRVHSRAPVVAPSRMDHGILQILAENKVGVIVTQANHAAEVGPGLAAAAKKLAQAGVATWNQSVLLKGVNDSPRELADLFQGLSGIGVKPYYLHHPDRVIGAMHFYLSLQEGWKIYSETLALVPPGSAPRYVVDLPGNMAKTEVMSLLGPDH